MKKISFVVLYLLLVCTATAFAEERTYVDGGDSYFTTSEPMLSQKQVTKVQPIEKKDVDEKRSNDTQANILNEVDEEGTKRNTLACVDDENNSSENEGCYIKLCTMILSNSDPDENREIKSSSDEYKKWKSAIQSVTGVNDKNICSFFEQDSRFATPERTWTFLKESLLNGKTEEALSCFSFGSLKKHQELFSYLGQGSLKHMAEEMKSIQEVTSNEGTAKYRTRRIEGQQEITYYVYFDNFAGNWKIRQF